MAACCSQEKMPVLLMLIHYEIAAENDFASHIDMFLIRHFSADQVFYEGAYSYIALGIRIFLNHIVQHGTPKPIGCDG